MPIYKQYVNVRRTLAPPGEYIVSYICTVRCFDVDSFCSCIGIFSICWCFDGDMHAICCSCGIGKAIFLPPTKEEVNAFVSLSVCLQDYLKMRAWIWMKCCVSTDVGTWTN